MGAWVYRISAPVERCEQAAVAKTRLSWTKPSEVEIGGTTLDIWMGRFESAECPLLYAFSIEAGNADERVDTIAEIIIPTTDTPGASATT